MMFRKFRVGVVIPCFNEQNQVLKVLNSIPSWIDSVIVVDDKSTDKTVEQVAAFAEEDNRVFLIQHPMNLGVGGAISSGYIESKNQNLDLVAVLAGDNQMDVGELPRLFSKLIDGNFDYVKTNRLYSAASRMNIPKVRFLGNYVLSILTKFASGYWNITDSQSGYAAISKRALSIIDWKKMYPRYGQPNDLLILLNIEDCRVADLPAMPVYNVGERSKMKIRVVIFTIPWLLLRGFASRIWEKYVLRKMHPISLFFFSSLFFAALSSVFFIRALIVRITLGAFPLLSTISILFCFSISLLLLIFALWLDYEYNLPLQENTNPKKQS